MNTPSTTSTTQLAIPSVHMNGTSRQELIRLNLEAIEAIDAAMEALGRAGPNGRDYYPQGPDATMEARRQHANRMHNLRAARDELTQITETIAS